MSIRIALGGLIAAGASPLLPPPRLGPLPPGPTTQVTTVRGELVAVALPHGASGRVWRLARQVNTKVLPSSSSTAPSAAARQSSRTG